MGERGSLAVTMMRVPAPRSLGAPSVRRAVAGLILGLVVLGAPPAWSEALPDFGAARNFALATQWGNRAWLAQLRPHVVVLTFFCIACDSCPSLMPALIERAWRANPSSPPRAWFVAVSVDPARDTVPALRRFARTRDWAAHAWLLLTGAPPEVEAVTRWYGVSIERTGPAIAHSCVAVLIDREGRIRGRYGSGDLERLDGDLARLLAAGVYPEAGHGRESRKGVR